MRGIFVTGTDTGVGKTFVTAGVARLLRQQGCAVRVCKPVATGARKVGERWLSDDTLQLADAAGQTGQWEAVTPWTFPDPVAPPVAARRQKVTLELPALVAAVCQQQRGDAALLVEGVGGLLCPLTEQHTVADLAAALQLPLVIVARRGLGTLNHTLLTLEVAQGRRLPVAGVIVNEPERADDLAAETNVAELRRLGIPVLAVVPHQDGPQRDATAALAHIDWRQVCHSTAVS